MQKRSVRRKKCVLALVLAVGIASAVFPAATSATQDPTTLPLLQFADLTYIGGFRLPSSTTNGDDFTFSGLPVAFNPANNSLFVGSRRGNVAEVSIPSAPVNSANPAAMPFASYLQGFADPTEGHFSEIATSGASMSGLLVYGAKLYGTGSIYYDANNVQRVSHFAHSTNLSQSSFAGMAQVWDTAKTGYVAGYMATVPAEWQSLLGGPAITGQCCIPIVTRTSAGPAAFSWNPSNIGAMGAVPASPLLYYTHDEHPTLANWAGSHPTYGATTEMGGMAVIAGTRTALYIGRNGTGPFCYGSGTSNAALAGTINPDGGDPWCYDPSNSSKGQHAYPYRYQMWAYDLKDFAAVKAGTKQPWEVVPYGVWPFTLPTPEATFRMGGVGYDAAHQTLYLSQMLADQDGYASRPVMHVLKVNAPPPVPVRTTAVEITANAAAPQMTGTPVTWTAQPAGGAAPHQYKWFSYAGGAWTALTGWNESTSFTWQPAAAAADARVGVWVRSAGNTEDALEATTNKEFAITATPSAAGSATVSAVSLAANKPSPQPANSAITFTAAPQGGAGPHQYKWWLFNGDTWTTVSAWTTSNSYTWTPATANSNYRVGVWVKSAGNSADALEASAESTFAIAGAASGPVSALALGANQVAPQAPGTVVTWTATPTGGVGPHQYKWFVFNGSWAAVTTWTTASTFAWTPSSASPDYRVGVWVRSAGNSADALESSAERGFVVSGTPVVATSTPVSAVSLTSSALPISAGQTATFTAAPVGGAGPHQYKWWVFDGGAWTNMGWTSSSTFTWKPVVANSNYRVGVWVKSAGNVADVLEASAELMTPVR